MGNYCPPMALITMSGFPCSGKTQRALQLKQSLEEHLQDPSYAGPQLKVSILSDDELKIGRDAYNGESKKPETLSCL